MDLYFSGSKSNHEIVLCHFSGWRSRKQFEESWMALLGVFSLSKDDLSDAEVAALAQASTVAVAALTGLLLQTLVLPSPGQNNLSEAIHHPRDYPSTFLTSRRGQQLTHIQNLIHDIDQGHLPVDSVCNLERSGYQRKGHYGQGQISVHYIQSSIRYNSVSASDHLSNVENKSTKSSAAFPLALIQREDAMSHSGLDTRYVVYSKTFLSTIDVVKSFIARARIDDAESVLLHYNSYTSSNLTYYYIKRS